MKQEQWAILTLIGGLCLLAFARGVYGLDEQSLWWDESLSHYRATKPFSFIITNQILIPSGGSYVSSTDNHPPLYFALLRVMVLTAGDSEFALRFPSLLAGVLLIPLLYQCGRRLAGQAGGVFAALLGAFSPLYLWYQQEARPYMLVTWLGLFSFYALSRLLSAWTHRGRAWRWSIWYVLAVAAMLLTHYHSFFLLAAQALVVVAWALHRQAIRWWIWLTMTAVIGAIAVPVAWWALRDVPIRADLPGYTFIPLHTLLLDVFRSFSVGPSAGNLPGPEWLGILLFITAGVILIVRRQSLPVGPTAATLACFGVPVILIFAVSFVRPVYMNIRHLIFASPFFYLFLALGAAQAWQTRARIWVAGIGVLVITMTISTWFYWTDPRYTKEDHRNWGRYLSEHIRPDDGVFVIPAPIFNLYEYYVHSAAPYVEMPIFAQDAEQTNTVLGQWVERYDRIWVAHSSTPDWANEGNMVVRWLEANTRRTQLVSFDSPIGVLHAHTFYTRLPAVNALPNGASTLDLNFEDQLVLLGLSQPAQGVAGGKSLPLTLYWRTQQPLVRDYRLTLALRDDNGLVWASMDTTPLQGAYPTSQWPVDVLIRDPVDLDLPPGIPPGRYQVRLSVYPADQSGPALAVYNLDNNALEGLIATIGEVEILSGGSGKQTLPAEVHKARWRDDGLRLLGYRYDSPVHLPGDVMVLHLYWQAARALRTDRSFTIRLVDANGAVVAGRSYPVSSRYPTSAWAKGEMVWEQYRLRIPVATPAGTYRLELIPAGSSRRPAALGTLTVVATGTHHEFALPPMQYTLGLNFGNQIELLGYDLESDVVRPGEMVSYTLYWRALQEIEDNYTVFNHLVAADGQMWGRWDGQPQKGGRSTSRWVPGEVIADPRQVPIAPDAPTVVIRPFVGVYNPLTMQRLPVYDAQGQIIADHAVLTQISIKSQ